MKLHIKVGKDADGKKFYYDKLLGIPVLVPLGTRILVPLGTRIEVTGFYGILTRGLCWVRL